VERERLRSQQSLAQTNLTLNRMRQAIESASDAIGIGDFEGNSLYHNQAHLAMFGYTVEELNAVPGGGVLFADREIALAIHAALQAGFSWSGEADVKTRDGRRIPAFVRADIIRDDEGQPVGIFGVFTDITERRRAERQLAEQQQRLTVTLQSISDAVITTDLEGRVVLMNPAAEQLTEKGAGDMAGRPLGELFDLRDELTREKRGSPVSGLLAQRTDSRSADAYILVTPSGAERLIAENAALIKAADGSVSGAVLALRDITRERRQADETARAGKLESLGLLAGSIAHDFGNLLTAIVGNLAVAQHSPGVPAPVLDRLALVERTAWRAKDVTRQLVTFARGGEPKKKRVELGPLIREAATFATANTAVTARFVIDPGLWAVEADEGQLVQVVNNLAVNAVQAMPEGGTLMISAENLRPGANSLAPAGDGRWVRLAVTDTGTGISPENMQRIFDPFFTTKKKGTGLGLATSYSIVKKHGGQLRVESTLGTGTTFHIILPGISNASATPWATPGRSPAEAALGRILLLDDEQAVRESVALMLGLLNYDVVEAADGAEAVEQFQTARNTGRAFDAVLLDLQVPGGLGGAETLRRLREIEPALRAIAIGEQPDDPVLRDCAAHGFAAALRKPFKMQELKQLLAAPRES
jgi:PAS domain S-box-containing protein